MINLFSELFPKHEFNWVRNGGLRAVGVCPFHDDHKPSLQIYTDQYNKQRWYCFADDFGGREVDAVQRAFNMKTREEANRWLTKHGYMAETEQDVEIREINEAKQLVYDHLNYLLRTDPRAETLRTYLQTRGVSLDFVKEYAIGFYPGEAEVVQYLVSKGISEERYVHFTLPKKENAKTTSTNLYNNSLVFFYRSSYDLWGRLKLRSVFAEKEKEKRIALLGPNNKHTEFYCAFKNVCKDDKAICVEGEFDVLGLVSLCKREDADSEEAIFCFGSGSNMEEGLNALTSLGVENTYIFPDNDAPGVKYATSIAENYTHTFIILPEDYSDGQDPCDWAKTRSFDDLLVAYRARVPAFQWIGKKFAESTDDSLEGQSRARVEVIKYAKKLSYSNREVFLRSFSHITGVSYEALIDEIATLSDLRYRKSLSPEAFGIHMVVGKPKQDKPPEWEHISNTIIEFDKEIVMDYGEDVTAIENKEMAVLGTERKERAILLRVTTPTRALRVRVSVEDFADDRKFIELLFKEVGTEVWIKPRMIPYVKEAATLLPLTEERQKEELIYMHTGWRNGMYLMPNGYVDDTGFHTLGDVKVELPKSKAMFRRYRLEEPLNKTDEKDLLEVLKDDILRVFPYETTLPIFAHIMLAPLINLINSYSPYCLWVRGTSGKMKTTYSALLCSFFGDFGRGEGFETWRSTGNSLEKNGYYLKDCVYVIDDFKRIDVSDKVVTSLIQNYGDRHGRGRLRADTTNQQTWYVRGLLLATGEDMPIGESSVLARMLIHPIKHEPNLDRLTKGQQYRKFLPSLMVRFLQHIAKNLDYFTSEAAQDKLQDYVRRYGAAHARVSGNVGLNHFAWDVAAEVFGLQHLTAEYERGINSILANMNEATVSEKPSTIFTESMRDILSSNNFYLSKKEQDADIDLPEPDQHAQIIGFIDEDSVYLLSSMSLGEVNTLRKKIYDQTVKYSARAIYEQLEADNVLITFNGKLTGVIRVKGSTHRVIRLRRGVVEDYESTNTKAKLTDNVVRYKEE